MFEVTVIVFFILLSGILEKDELKASHKKKELFSSYTWNITNKYYAAAVDIYHIKEKNIVGKDFSSEVEAVIAVFDSKKVIKKSRSYTFINAK